jgi:hypothetical protein
MERDDATVTDDATRATLVVQRDAQARQNARASYAIEVDGEVVAHIQRGEQLTIPVPSGTLRVAVTISRAYRSQTLVIDVAPSQTLRLRCGPKRKRFALQGLVQPNDYLWLERAPE